MKVYFFVWSLLATLTVSGSRVLAQNAPAQLRGKSIAVSWTETRMQRIAGEGEFRQRSVPQSLTVYVSTNGQMFARRSATNNKGRSGSYDRVGNGGVSNVGGARIVRFNGRSLNVTASLGSGGARSVTINFDNGFSGCSAHVILGSERGQTIKGKSLATGAPLEIRSASAGGESCGIRDGNVFSN